MARIRKVLNNKSSKVALIDFFREIKLRLKFQFAIWFVLTWLFLGTTVYFGVNPETNDLNIWLFIIFLILTLFSASLAWWKGYLLLGVSQLIKVFKTRYRTSLIETIYFTKVYFWLLRSFLSYRIVGKKPMIAIINLQDEARDRLIIDFRRVNTPEVDIWFHRLFVKLYRFANVIFLFIPRSMAFFNFLHGIGRPRTRRNIKQDFSKIHDYFLTNLIDRTIW